MPGTWHNEMENLFPEDMREIRFLCSSKKYRTSRIADICLSKNRTCEIQHSYISEHEIINRFNDWNKFGKEIIWMIDGNVGIQIDKLSTENYLLKFNQLWKYKSFIKKYDFILIEINKHVFKIELSKIRSSMIELKEPKELNEVIDFLKTQPENIWTFWKDDNVVKSTLGVYQQGAGNGKTYGIWKSIMENVDRKTFIIVTKQNSAKTVIYQELIDQKERYSNNDKGFNHIENFTKDSEENTYSHFVIKFTNKNSNKENTIGIGTIDSFMLNLYKRNSLTPIDSDFFAAIVDGVSTNGATKLKNGFMNFGGQHIQLSKESELWIDEVQDLSPNYLHAVLKLMYETSCYVNIVGDKLQSLDYTDNFLTSIEEGFPNIKVDIKKQVNINRRIKVNNMANAINKLVKFDKYNLPSIECDKDIPKESNENPIKFINQTGGYHKDQDKIDALCDKIMEKYKYEVETNDYLPNDFLVIFPIMKQNDIAVELQTKIQKFWVEKYCNMNYNQYVHLHKHTEGTVINTNDSVNATRIMSIKSVKGDGRSVVFLLGISENALKKVSNNEIGLLYESYWHVALTRAKNQIYLGRSIYNDDINRRLGSSGYEPILPDINKKISLDNIIEFINKNNLIEMLVSNNINFNSIMEKELKIEIREKVDWGYHIIKNKTYYYNIILNIIDNKEDNLSEDDSQLFTVLRIISKLPIKTFEVIEFYKYLEENQAEQLRVLPICKLSDKEEYEHYYNLIYKKIEKIQQHIENGTIRELNVYESIILTYMISIFKEKKYSDITVMDTYNITDFFQKNSKKELELLKHISYIKDMISSSGINEYKGIKWNINKHIRFEGQNDNFRVYKSNYTIIGFNDTDIIHIVLESSLNAINFWNIMTKTLLERFIIYNPESDEDKQRYKDKKINTFIFVLDNCSVIKFDWCDWDKDLYKEIKNEIKFCLELYCQNKHNDIYNYFSFLKHSNLEEWEKEPDKLIDRFIKKFREKHKFSHICYPEYIIKFFEDINTKIEDEEDYDYVNNLESFNKKLSKKLNISIKKYSGC